MKHDSREYWKQMYDDLLEGYVVQQKDLVRLRDLVMQAIEDVDGFYRRLFLKKLIRDTSGRSENPTDPEAEFLKIKERYRAAAGGGEYCNCPASCDAPSEGNVCLKCRKPIDPPAIDLAVEGGA